MKIITTVYGDSHTEFAQVLILSLLAVGHRREDIVVVASETEIPRGLLDWLDAKQIQSLRYTWGVPLGEGRSRRAAKKVSAWRFACKTLSDGDRAVFLDADMLALQPLLSAFEGEPGFDIAYTVARGRWPVNSGVLFVRASSRVLEFFRFWDTHISWISSEGWAILAETTWGAVDQMALVLAVKAFSGHDGLTFRALPGSVWNETNCPRDLSWTNLVHLKGCLPLLLKQRPYGPQYGDERNPRFCEPVFEIWRKYLKEVSV